MPTASTSAKPDSDTISVGMRSPAALIVGTLLIAGALLGTYLQEPKREPAEQASARELFLEPIERNGAARLPVIDGKPRFLNVSPDGRSIWVGGEKSLLQSTDGGETWTERLYPELPSEAELDRLFPPPPVPSPPVPAAPAPVAPPPKDINKTDNGKPYPRPPSAEPTPNGTRNPKKAMYRPTPRVDSAVQAVAAVSSSVEAEQSDATTDAACEENSLCADKAEPVKPVPTASTFATAAAQSSPKPPALPPTGSTPPSPSMAVQALPAPVATTPIAAPSGPASAGPSNTVPSLTGPNATGSNATPSAARAITVPDPAATPSDVFESAPELPSRPERSAERSRIIDVHFAATTEGRCLLGILVGWAFPGNEQLLLYHSTNGSAWSPIKFSIPDNYAYSFKPYLFDQTIYVSCSEGLYRGSLPDGSWELVKFQPKVPFETTVDFDWRYAVMTSEKRGFALAFHSKNFQDAAFTTDDGGKSWIFQDFVEDAITNLAPSVDGSTAWLIWDQDQVQGGAQIWPPRTSFAPMLRSFSNKGIGTARPLPFQYRDPDGFPSVFFLDDKNGWSGPELRRTTDGGATWTSTSFPATENVSEMAFGLQGTNVGWLASEQGLFRTTDGGETWHRRSLHTDEAAQLGPHSSWPAGWFYVALGLGLSLVLFGMRSAEIGSAEGEASAKQSKGWTSGKFDSSAPSPGPAGHKPEPGSKVCHLLADGPVEDVLNDKLGFRDVAVGLAQFLRNPKTAPPLTVAISGRWGSGKTSIMKMTETELRREQYPTVWFNAWHHRQETSMLAALLVQVRAKVSLPWMSKEGLPFRLKLVWKRFNSATFPRWKLALAIMAMSLGIGYAYVNREPFYSVADTTTHYVDKHLLGEPGPAMAHDKKAEPSDWLILTLFGTATFKVVSFLRGAAKVFPVFALDPTKLLTQLTENPKPVDLTEQLGFRTQFAREFREALESLESALGQRLVIFIDDLDRCQPQHVIEVLETVNYMVSSGPCIVVFGIAEEEVRHYVGLHFRAVANSMAKDPSSKEGGRRLPPGVPGQLKFASRYLEKLINVEIRVPQADLAHLHAMVAGIELPPADKAPNERKTDRPPSRLVKLARGAKPYVNAVSLAAMVLLCLKIGSEWESPSQAKQNLAQSTAGKRLEEKPTQGTPNSQVAANSPTATASGTATAATSQTNEANASRAPEAAPPPRLAAATVKTPSRSSASRSIWPFAAFGFFGVVTLFTLRSDRVPRTKPIDDSLRFTDALKIWLPLIQTEDESPRTVKRFTNRVRLYTLRTRPVREWIAPESKPTRDPRTWPAWWRCEWFKSSGMKRFVLDECPHDESLLIAMAAIEEALPLVIADENAWKELTSLPMKREELLERLRNSIEQPPDEKERKLAEQANEKLLDTFVRVVRRHENRELPWPPTDDYREIVRRLSADLDV